MSVRAEIVEREIRPAALLEELASTKHGAVVLFVGTVREINEGKPVSGMEYRAYPEMARRELADIAQAAAERHDVALLVEHRIGALTLGDVSVAIAAAHGHRAPAFEAAREVIEEIKRRVPIWKREQYRDGTREWVHAGERRE